MFENTKVIRDFIWADISHRGLRKEYGFGNGKHGKHESRQIIYKHMQELAKNLVSSTGMELEVRGKENLPKQGPVLYVATHKSVFDIVILLTIIDDPTIFIGKKEVQKMPFVNQWFDALGCIYIDREDKRKALQSILEGISELKNGQSIVLFPEGTRNMNNEILPFKEGGFKLASKSNAPIIPIALSNTYKVFEEKKRIQKTKVVVNIGKPIEVGELTKEEIAYLPKLVEEKVGKLMMEIV
ncbi:MAG: 1-acyl-sn-glycerol-3-phosphate acyltransferase [Cellulosilyticum sp.]|nr:1-acyl-sn-glycerol-3-phosphate acyltransferase [Cellulosilyticum sp.]